MARTRARSPAPAPAQASCASASIQIHITEIRDGRETVQGQLKGAPWLPQSLSRVEIFGATVPPGYSTGRVVTVYRRIPTCPPAASFPARVTNPLLTAGEKQKIISFAV